MRPTRTTRTKQRNPDPEKPEPEVHDLDTDKPVRSTRTKQRVLEKSVEHDEQPKRSTRTKQRLQDTESSSSGPTDEPVRRTTRTKQRLLESGSDGSDREGLTRALASPRVKELALRALSPGGKNIPSPRQAFAGETSLQSGHAILATFLYMTSFFFKFY